MADAEGNIILNQVMKYRKKRPAWSQLMVRYYIILRNLSTKAYEYLQYEQFL